MVLFVYHHIVWYYIIFFIQILSEIKTVLLVSPELVQPINLLHRSQDLQDRSQAQDELLSARRTGAQDT